MFLAAFLTRQIQILQVQRTNHASHVSRLYPSILHPVVWAFSLQAQHYTSAEVAMVLPWDFVNFEKQLLLWARRTGCGEGSNINILRQTQCFHHPFSWYKIYTWVYQHSWPPSFNILQTPGVGWNWDGHGVFFLGLPWKLRIQSRRQASWCLNPKANANPKENVLEQTTSNFNFEDVRLQLCPCHAILAASASFSAQVVQIARWNKRLNHGGVGKFLPQSQTEWWFLKPPKKLWVKVVSPP